MHNYSEILPVIAAAVRESTVETYADVVEQFIQIDLSTVPSDGYASLVTLISSVVKKWMISPLPDSQGTALSRFLFQALIPIISNVKEAAVVTSCGPVVVDLASVAVSGLEKNQTTLFQSVCEGLLSVCTACESNFALMNSAWRSLVRLHNQPHDGIVLQSESAVRLAIVRLMKELTVVASALHSGDEATADRSAKVIRFFALHVVSIFKSDAALNDSCFTPLLESLIAIRTVCLDVPPCIPITALQTHVVSALDSLFISALLSATSSLSLDLLVPSSQIAPFDGCAAVSRSLAILEISIVMLQQASVLISRPSVLESVVTQLPLALVACHERLLKDGELISLCASSVAAHALLRGSLHDIMSMSLHCHPLVSHVGREACACVVDHMLTENQTLVMQMLLEIITNELAGWKLNRSAAYVLARLLSQFHPTVREACMKHLIQLSQQGGRSTGCVATVFEFSQVGWISSPVIQSMLETGRKMLLEHNGEPAQILIALRLLRHSIRLLEIPAGLATAKADWRPVAILLMQLLQNGQSSTPLMWECVMMAEALILVLPGAFCEKILNSVVSAMSALPVLQTAAAGVLAMCGHVHPEPALEKPILSAIANLSRSLLASSQPLVIHETTAAIAYFAKFTPFVAQLEQLFTPQTRATIIAYLQSQPIPPSEQISLDQVLVSQHAHIESLLQIRYVPSSAPPSTSNPFLNNHNSVSSSSFPTSALYNTPMDDSQTNFAGIQSACDALILQAQALPLTAKRTVAQMLRQAASSLDG